MRVCACLCVCAFECVFECEEDLLAELRSHVENETQQRPRAITHVLKFHTNKRNNETTQSDSLCFLQKRLVGTWTKTGTASPPTRPNKREQRQIQTQINNSSELSFNKHD